jgi:Tfp pilus assembly protein PilN
MAYNGIAWPGLTLSLKAINRERAKVSRWLRALEDNPKAYKRPKQMRTKWQAMLADLDTGAKVLRDCTRAVQSPRRTKVVKRVSVEQAMSGKIL